MKISIVRPKKEDLEELNKLFRSSIVNTFKEEGLWESMRDLAEGAIEDLTTTLLKDLDHDGQSEHHLVAKVDGIITGTIAYGIPNQIIQDHIEINIAKTPEIKSVYILPEYQGQGIGSSLFLHMCQHMTEIHFTEFCLDSGYKKAQSFWGNKLGDPVSILKDYWTAGSDHVIWKAALPI